MREVYQDKGFFTRTHESFSDTLYWVKDKGRIVKGKSNGELVEVRGDLAEVWCLDDPGSVYR